ncbi:transposase [Candidatus Gottesmanbacteria bacterium]|nr:transposase [Candidatus Gottesmanbacteria bacterium]
MAHRSIPLISNQYYHLFNRSIAKQPIFLSSSQYLRFLELIDFYRFTKPGLRYSHFNRLPVEEKSQFLKLLYKKDEKLINILSFSLMPNHFHFLAQQVQDNGIKIFMSQIQNSYARYFNTRQGRSGALFQEMFKAVRIESDDQLIHVVRYIHLNPLTSYVIKEIAEIENYPWTSFIDYMGKRNLPLISKNMIMDHFSNTQKLKSFTLDQLNYQRSLEKIKHLIID